MGALVAIFNSSYPRMRVSILFSELLNSRIRGNDDHKYENLPRIGIR
jgi:hypothetical protein